MYLRPEDELMLFVPYLILPEGGLYCFNTFPDGGLIAFLRFFRGSSSLIYDGANLGFEY
jgi:hypothetical protein